MKVWKDALKATEHKIFTPTKFGCPMTHTHYIATPVSEKPKENGTYLTSLGWLGFADGKWFEEDGEYLPEFWLKPCTETGAVDEGKFAEYKKQFDQNFAKEDPKEFVKRMESLGYVFEDVLCIQFAEWIFKNKLLSKVSYIPHDNKWMFEIEKYNWKTFTTSELIEILKAETQKT